MLNHKFAVMAWIRPSTVTGSQYVLTKINESTTDDDTEKLFVFGLNGAKIYCILTTTTLSDDPSTPTDEKDFTKTEITSTGADVVVETWVHITINSSFETDGTALTFYKDGTINHSATG